MAVGAPHKNHALYVPEPASMSWPGLPVFFAIALSVWSASQRESSIPAAPFSKISSARPKADSWACRRPLLRHGRLSGRVTGEYQSLSPFGDNRNIATAGPKNVWRRRRHSNDKSTAFTSS
jgi:hypothetical protein